MKKKYTLLDLKKAAKKNNGECLSTQYHGALSNHLWLCNVCLHEWNATWSGVNNRGSWCPKCSAKNGAKKRWPNIKLLIKHAKSKNGFLISTSITTSKVKVKWECEFGHKWNATWEKVKRGTWCPECAKSKKHYKYDINDMKKIAKTYGGVCLSEKYLGIFEPLEFKCANNHIFQRKPASLTKKNPLQRFWCTQCNGIFYAEEICRNVFEIAYGKSFFNLYPGAWLVNNSGNKMQLDGYNAELNIAFEFQGKQHDIYVPFFQKSSKELKRRKINDQIKKSLCKENGVRLVIINEFESRHGLNEEKIISHVREACNKIDLVLPKVSQDELKKRNMKIFNKRINDLKECAKTRGGELISKSYRGSKYPLVWKCGECDHEWESSPISVYNQGTWCPKCAGNFLVSIEEVRKLAKDLDGELMSTEYNNSNTHLNWKCGQCNHEWEATYSNVKRGHWCPQCPSILKKQKSLDELKSILLENGDQLLSEYISSDIRVSLKCKNGHIWSDVPDRIKNRRVTCHECSINQKRKNFQIRLEKIIKQNEATLEGKYTTSKSKIKIKCKYGHDWVTNPSSVFMGVWCPVCVKEKKRLEAARNFEEIIGELNIQLLSTYKNAKTHVTLYCRCCKNKWSMTPDHFQQKKSCKNCTNKLQKIEK